MNEMIIGDDDDDASEVLDELSDNLQTTFKS